MKVHGSLPEDPRDNMLENESVEKLAKTTKTIHLNSAIPARI